MATFTVGKPIRTNTPGISVDADMLPVGIHRFRLEVVGANGAMSVGDERLIEVVDRKVLALQPARVMAAKRPGAATSASRATTRKPRSKK
jgi:hypothetical protein